MKRTNKNISRAGLGTDGPAAGLVLAGLLMGATATSAQAQPGKPRGQIEEAGIEIVKIRINDLPEATRNFDKVALPELPKADRKVTYTYPDFRLPADRLNPSVRVLSVRAEEPEPLMGNYLKAGLGNFATFYGRAHLHSTRREDYSYGLDIKHINSFQGPVDSDNSGLSQTSAALNGELYKGTAALGATLDFGRERYNFYGYDRNRVQLPEKSDLKQVFNRFGIKAYARNRDPDNIIQYEAGLGFRRWSDDYAARENNVLVNGKAGYALGETSRLTLAADASFITDQDSAHGRRNRTFAQATPAYELTGKRVSLLLGITAGYSSDTLNGVSKTALYPAVRAGYTVLPEKFMVYAGLGGALQRVTRYDLSTENYWLNPNLNVADTHRGPTIYGGFTSAPARGLELNARATYSRDKNLYFYLNNPENPARFDLVYDQQTTGLLNVHGELLYNQAEKFRLGARVDYNQYSLETLAKPFHPARVSEQRLRHLQRVR